MQYAATGSYSLKTLISPIHLKVQKIESMSVASDGSNTMTEDRTCPKLVSTGSRVCTPFEFCFSDMLAEKVNSKVEILQTVKNFAANRNIKNCQPLYSTSVKSFVIISITGNKRASPHLCTSSVACMAFIKSKNKITYVAV